MVLKVIRNPFELDDEAVERYARHLILPEIGGRGQRLLLDATVVVAGDGAAASEALMFLAAAGVGRLVVTGSIADVDVEHARALNPGVTIVFGSVGEAAETCAVQGDSRVTGALGAMRVVGRVVGLEGWRDGADWQGLDAIAGLVGRHETAA